MTSRTPAAFFGRLLSSAVRLSPQCNPAAAKLLRTSAEATDRKTQLDQNVSLSGSSTSPAEVTAHAPRFTSPEQLPAPAAWPVVSPAVLECSSPAAVSPGSSYQELGHLAPRLQERQGPGWARPESDRVRESGRADPRAAVAVAAKPSARWTALDSAAWYPREESGRSRADPEWAELEAGQNGSSAANTCRCKSCRML